MSSQHIMFTSGLELKPGMKAEIAVAWPSFRDGRIRLQLVLKATITGSQEGVVNAHITAYDFRTCRPTEAEQGAEPEADMRLRLTQRNPAGPT